MRGVKMRGMLALVCVMALAVGCMSAAERNNTANQLTQQQHYATAVHLYQLAQVLDPDAPIAYYNAGVALAEIDQLDAAQQALAYAITKADETLVKQAYYNLGNVYYRAGAYFEAVEAFKAVLLRDPTDADARYNYELALMYAVDPTPPHQQQQNEPQPEDSDPNTTPSPQPNALTGPTPTPPRQSGEPQASQTPQGGDGDFFGDDPSALVPQNKGRMSLEEAQRLLESIVQDLPPLSLIQKQSTPSGDLVEKDW